MLIEKVGFEICLPIGHFIQQGWHIDVWVGFVVWRCFLLDISWWYVSKGVTVITLENTYN